MKNPVLSIVILSYNTKQILADCLSSLKKLMGEVDFEVVVCDNGSNDGSVELIKKDFPSFKVIENKANLGFAAGNNRAKSKIQGEYVLFLNSDTKVPTGTLKRTLECLMDHPEIGALGCKIVLPDGTLDKDSRRSFPTPWVAFSHLMIPLDRLFPKSRFFAKYWYGYKSEDETHEVDVLQGAFFLTRRNLLNKVGWFDEDYFLDGEDIDLCWKIKALGYKVVYFPEVSILHIKGVTKGKHKLFKGKVPLEHKLKFRMSGVNSMEIFYRKRLWHKYPLPLSILVLLGIRLVKAIRFVKVVTS
jgi:GT2 family glycosyltransferase